MPEITSYKTLEGSASAEIVVKKSRFIANAFPVSSEEQAQTLIEKMKKQYYDARHNCYAYRIGKDGKAFRYSDDGEPQGTAGIPMLDVLRGENITEALVVITRYFGGILLGTGGLSRAYSGAAKEGILSAGIIEKRLCREIIITADYSLHGKLTYFLANNSCKIIDTAFTYKITITAAAPAERAEKTVAEIINITNGKASAVLGESFYE